MAGLQSGRTSVSRVKPRRITSPVLIAQSKDQMLPYTGRGGVRGGALKTRGLAKERDATKQYASVYLPGHLHQATVLASYTVGYHAPESIGPMFTFRSTVAAAFAVTVEQLTDSRNTTGPVTRARHALRYALHLSGWSKNKISKEQGVDRQTVQHSCRKAMDLIITDPEFRANWKAVAETLKLSAWG